MKSVISNKMTIQDVGLKGKRCFVRVDFNVPVDEYGNITDDKRIRSVLPTINYLIDNDAKIILASHMGRPKGQRDPSLSLKVVVPRLQRHLSREVQFVEDCIGEKVQKKVAALKNGEILLLENLRFYLGEEQNDEEFSKELASLADIYINDAFATAHRIHASTNGITQFVSPCVCGFLMTKEINYFTKAVETPIRPVVAILGGSKASSKLGVLHNLIDKVDKIILGGGLCFTFLKARGYEVGKNIVDENMLEEVQSIMQYAREKQVKFYLPVDFVIAEGLDVCATTKIVPYQEIPPNWYAPDIGPASVALFKEALESAKTILWNGPMGVFEIDSFSRGTMAMIQAVVDSYAMSIVGGGDTDVAVHRAGESDKISYISTGGGAFLELLEGNVLPAITVLTEKSAVEV